MGLEPGTSRSSARRASLCAIKTRGFQPAMVVSSRRWWFPAGDGGFQPAMVVSSRRWWFPAGDGGFQPAMVVSSRRWWFPAGDGGFQPSMVVSSRRWWFPAGDGGFQPAIGVSSRRWCSFHAQLLLEFILHNNLDGSIQAINLTGWSNGAIWRMSSLSFGGEGLISRLYVPSTDK